MYLHVCPVCTHRNVRGSRFCNECGAPLQLRFCPACHAAADVLDLKCAACGATLPQVALSEAADLPPEFLAAQEAPPAATGADRDEPAKRPERSVGEEREAPIGKAVPVREPSSAAAQRAPSVAAHAPVSDPLDPLTAPNFVPHGDPHGDPHRDPPGDLRRDPRGDPRGDRHGDLHGPDTLGPFEDTATRFAAAKTASIIERLYGRSAPRVSAPPPPLEPGDRAAKPRGSVIASIGLMLFGLVFFALFFAATEPPAPVASRPNQAPAVENSTPATMPATELPSDPATTPQRTSGGSIKGLLPEAPPDTTPPPAGGVERDRAANASAPTPAAGSGTEAATPASSRAPDRSAGRPQPPSRAPVATSNAATSNARPASAPGSRSAPVPPSKPAPASPCSPEVAALGLCTPAN